MIAPEGSLVFHEKAWNAYPYCRTSTFMDPTTECTFMLFLNASETLLTLFFLPSFSCSCDGEWLFNSHLPL